MDHLKSKSSLGGISKQRGLSSVRTGDIHRSTIPLSPRLFSSVGVGALGTLEGTVGPPLQEELNQQVVHSVDDPHHHHHHHHHHHNTVVDVGGGVSVAIPAPPTDNPLSGPGDGQGPEIVVGESTTPTRPHEVAERKGKLWVCGHCRKLFAHSGSFNRHVHVVHDKQKIYPCKECHKTFGMRAHLNTHLAAVHEKRRDNKCKFCSHAFSDSSNLIKHIRARHKDQKDSLFKCNYCDESFSWRYELTAHLKRLHQQEDPS